jgi:hypothetical protein
MIWFLFIHSPPILIQSKVLFDPPFALHMLGAYAVYLVCAWNSLFTPSISAVTKAYHVWFGRIGMIAGIGSFGMGAFCAWWPFRNNLPPMAFAIGITFGGLMQLYFQYRGYTAIRRYQELKEQIQTMLLTQAINNSNNNEAEFMSLLHAEKEKCLHDHVHNMCALFVVGCGAPAGIRLTTAVLGNDSGATSTLVLVFTVVVLTFLIRPFSNTFFDDSNKQQLDVPEILPSSSLTPLLQN